MDCRDRLQLAESRVNFLEGWAGDRRLHSKCMIVDDRYTIIGSGERMEGDREKVEDDLHLQPISTTGVCWGREIQKWPYSWRTGKW